MKGAQKDGSVTPCREGTDELSYSSLLAPQHISTAFGCLPLQIAHVSAALESATLHGHTLQENTKLSRIAFLRPNTQYLDRVSVQLLANWIST